MRTTTVLLCVVWLRLPSLASPRSAFYQKEAADDEPTEFVRTQWSDAVYKKLRTYSTNGGAEQVHCYSCMSLSYQQSWKYLESLYLFPKMFTNRCSNPQLEPRMPTVRCSTVCVSLMEPEIEAGIFIGYKHIRGCLDRILRNGFNQSALSTHRVSQTNMCRTLSRALLFNRPKDQEYAALGDVQLCSCYGDRCNSSSRLSFPLFLLVVILLVFHPWPRIA